MNNLDIKQKNLNKIIDKLSNLTTSYSQSQYNSEKITTEKNQLVSEKNEIEKKHLELLREHEYLKKKKKSFKEKLI